MQNTDYYQHEHEYRRLRSEGFAGWGAEAFERRMKGQQETLKALMASTHFPPPGSNVLELGSGAGDSALPYAHAGYKVTGLEISPTAVAWANENFEQHGLERNFIQASIASALPFAEKSFDAVLDSACLHCLTDADRLNAIAEISRVLRPDGFLLIGHMVNDPRELGEGISFNPTTRAQERNGMHYRSMPQMVQLLTELKMAGFSVVHQKIKVNAWWDHAELWCKKLVT